MEKVIKHFASLSTLIFFLFAAISSINISNPLPTCDELENKHKELGYYLCDPLPSEIIKQNEFTIKILDKETGKPIPSVKVKVYSLPVLLDKLNYCDKCYGKLNNYKDNVELKLYWSDTNGEISGKTAEIRYLDKRDVQVVMFLLDHDDYCEKFVDFRFAYNMDKIQQSIVLLENNL